MKYILEFILATIILFFVWNILKKIFLNTFYQYTKVNNPKENVKEKSKNLNSKINWDAETVDYEEIKETNTENNGKK